MRGQVGAGPEAAFKTVASRWHTQHNKYPEKRRFHLQVELLGSLRSRGAFINKLPHLH